MIQYIENEEEKRTIAEQILNRLPAWFGIPESTEHYIRDSGRMPFWAVFEGGAPVGFIALKQTGPVAAEIFVMGVLPEYHRRGVGTALWDSFLRHAVERGFEYVQVKTVRRGRYAEYDATNSFYESLGFRELECFPTLWDEQNPCQVYVKWIGSPGRQAGPYGM